MMSEDLGKLVKYVLIKARLENEKNNSTNDESRIYDILTDLKENYKVKEAHRIHNHEYEIMTRIEGTSEEIQEYMDKINKSRYIEKTHTFSGTSL